MKAFVTWTFPSTHLRVYMFPSRLLNILSLHLGILVRRLDRSTACVHYCTVDAALFIIVEPRLTCSHEIPKPDQLWRVRDTPFFLSSSPPPSFCSVGGRERNGHDALGKQEQEEEEE
jgi:hypothetical protein